ncbi:NEDD4-binding protein 3-A [Brachyhypopomus gauderio]|uniref:NEDD4-binding protein 3-A n=1 Tax=Brachyhypopomus gauderio TaxID=698409 RepID=UPI0040428FEE
MATVQALPLTRDPSKSISALYPPSSLASAGCIMGSVGSLIEKPDISPTKSNRAVPQVAERHGGGPLRKGLNQRELLNYLNITKKESKAGKRFISGASSIKREHSREEESVCTKVYHRDGKEVDVSKNSLPIGGKFDKHRLRPSAFKPVTPKIFSSMQNLYASKSEDLTNSTHQSGGKPASKSLSTSSSSSSPSRARTSANKGVLAPPRGPSQEEETTSDSGHNSMSSLPPYRPPFRPHLSQISASMGHIDHIGSLDRTSVAPRGGVSVGKGGVSCRNVSALGRASGYGDTLSRYELSRSVEEVIGELEERLQEKEHELRQMRRNLDESEDAVAQVFEGKQRLWEKEVCELKQLYATRLRHASQQSQQSQRSQRTLQLQLFKAQQERGRLQDELRVLRLECQGLQSRASPAQGHKLHPQLEETQWEVCQKAGEISLLKQQLRDSQAEVAQKLGEIFLLKTQLRETRAEVRAKDSQIDMLQMALQAVRHKGGDPPGPEDARAGDETPGSTEERLRAELLLERRQNEAQATAFEAERGTWQVQKEKVLRYQRELQASYLEMYHKNESLERELRQLRGGGAEPGVTGGGEQGGATEEKNAFRSLPWIERTGPSEI